MTRERYACALCDREYRSRASALQCCSDTFGDRDGDRDPRAFTAPDAHGCPIVTDGSCPIPQGDAFTEPWRYRCPNCESTQIRRKAGSRTHRENPEAFDCKQCSTHFDDPLDAKAHSDDAHADRLITDGGRVRGLDLPHEWHRLDGIERDLLVAIRCLQAQDEDLSGQNIARECERFRDDHMSNGLIYPRLSNLTESGFIAKHDDEGAAANRYELTDAGEQALAAHVATFEMLFEDREGQS